MNYNILMTALCVLPCFCSGLKGDITNLYLLELNKASTLHSVALNLEIKL